MFIADLPLKMACDITENLAKLNVPEESLVELGKAMDLLILWGAINSDEIKLQSGSDLKDLFYTKVEALTRTNDH